MDGRTCRNQNPFAYFLEPPGGGEAACEGVVPRRMTMPISTSPIRAVGAPEGRRAGNRDTEKQTVYTR